ncbi:MAG: Na+/H+-dicarboxylate symporter [Congregibacter sp.]
MIGGRLWLKMLIGLALVVVLGILLVTHTFAVFGLITRLVENIGIEVLAGMAIYVVTVVLGLLIISVLYFIVAKITLTQSFRVFFSNISELLL